MKNDELRYTECHYDITTNILARVADHVPQQRQVVPTLAQLASVFHSSDSITLHVDMGSGGGISCAAGVLEWIEDLGVTAQVTVVLGGYFPLGNLPIAATPPLRMNWLKKRFPQSTLVISEAANAKHLSQYQPSDELQLRASDSAALDEGSRDTNSSISHSVPGLMVLGTGSSVGKGSSAFLIGSILKQSGLTPVPFKATGCIESRHDQLPAQRCTSTLMHWANWNGTHTNLPSFLNPVLITPSAEQSTDGRIAVFDADGSNCRVCDNYRLDEYFSDNNWHRLSRAFEIAFRRTADFVDHEDGILIAEGAGSPLEMTCKWDFANEYPRHALGLASLLVTSNDNRGFFALLGTLEEIRHRNLQPVEAVIACETTP